MEHTMIEVKKLDTSPRNVRRTAALIAMEELKASILAHGLMQNLVVTDNGQGRYHVIAGGRRLEALRQLQAEGKLPADHAVPCQLVADEHAAEMSLAENIVRQAMHPADEFEAFAGLLSKGESVDAVAQRFGKTTRYVEQRLRLGRLAPELLAAYRDEALTLDCLMAFAITDDHGKQLEVFASLAPWQRDNASEIRSMLTGEMCEASSKLARFVGLDAYHAAGGQSRADLFGDRVYLENAELLHRLAAEKLEAAGAELEAEGWHWVEISPDRDWSVTHACGHIYPQPVAAPVELLAARERAEAELETIHDALEDTESDALLDALEEAQATLAEIEEKLDSYVAYDPDEMRVAGCYVSIGHDGELAVEKGLVRREDMKRLTASGDAGPARPKTMPQTLKRDLEAYRLQAAQVEIATHRLVALDLLAFTLARQAVAKRPVDSGPDVRCTPHHATTTVQREHTTAAQALDAIAAALPVTWLHQESEAEQFQAFISLSDKDKLDFLAYAVALSLKPQLSSGHEGTACELALSLTDADVARYWRPARSNYLGRITRDQLLALGRGIFGESWSQTRSRDKKGELADYLERAFADPEGYGRTPQQREQLAHWLPPGMAFGAVEPTSEASELAQAA